MGSLPCLVWGSGSGDLALPDDRPYVYLFRGFADLGLGLFEVPVEVGLGVDEVADHAHALGQEGIVCLGDEAGRLLDVVVDRELAERLGEPGFPGVPLAIASEPFDRM